MVLLTVSDLPTGTVPFIQNTMYNVMSEDDVADQLINKLSEAELVSVTIGRVVSAQ